MSTIVIASGGTGGHLYPTIAVAEEIRATHPEVRIVFVGTNNRIESREVPRLGFEFFPIEIAAPGRSIGSLARFPMQYYKAYRRSKKILAEVGASAFLGGGAYLSVPVAFAAHQQKIPIALLEINAVAGRANRVIAKNAQKIFISYKESASQFPSSLSSRIEIIGTPVRDSLSEKINVHDARKFFGLDPEKKTLLAFGGSLGARSLNDAMKYSAKKIIESGYNIIWQTGSLANIHELKTNFSDTSRICIREFISEMPTAYAASDLVVARAGASTLAELSTLGKPAILVPYPLAAMNHQEKNAMAYSNCGAATVISDSEIGAKLEDEVLRLMADGRLREAMAKKIFNAENITAKNVVAEYLVSCAKQE